MFNFQPKPLTEGWGDLREVQTWESSKLFGRPIRYLKPEQVKENLVFGESVARNFNDDTSYAMWAFRSDDTHFAGTEAFGGFGLIPQYNDMIHIPVKWFKDLSIEPIEGDVIYYINEDVLFEISKVTPLNEQFEGDRINERQFNYKIYLKLYHLADDNFNVTTTDVTKITALDDIDLNTLNDDMEGVIDSLEIVQPADSKNPFGDLS